MSVLVIAEHDNSALKPATLSTIAAAAELGDGTGRVTGHNCRAAADAAAKTDKVAKVLLAEDPPYEHALAEPLSLLVAAQAKNFAAVLAPATTFGKNVMPRVAALLDVAQISEIVAVKGADTFVRPIYAGNALATVKSADAIKVITVRATGFGAVAATGGSASVEKIAAAANPGKSKFLDQQL